MIRLLYIFLVLFSAPALATPIVADISNYKIMIDSHFNGTRLFLFGARNDSGDVVVVVRGPEKNYVVWKKEKISGLWVNSKRIKLFNIPDYYAIASSRPFAADENQKIFSLLGIGYERLLQDNAFTQAFLAHQSSRRHYINAPASLDFMGETLFKTTIEFPDNIPPGAYTAEIYLLRDGEVTGVQSIPISVEKAGIDAFLFDYAHQYPLIYGISAVVIALSAGWFAGRLFESRFA